MEIIRGIRFKKFLEEEVEKEKKDLDESYQQSKRNKKERTTLEKLQKKLEPLPSCPTSDE